MHLISRRLLPSLLLATAALAASAQAPAPAASSLVTVQGAWARTSVPGQSGTGAFMTLTASQAMTLVGVATPVAGVAELHEMKMEGDVMKMRAIAELPLPAGKAVELKPGGHHLMLMDLKQALKPDTRVPVTLRLRDAKGALHQVELSVPVAARAPGPAAHSGGHKH